jgi:glycosyltransferase involved in cell wall biosynthesis
MKILQSIPYFVPAWDYGGSVFVCYHLSERLVSLGHDVTVYTTDSLNARERIRARQETINGIRVNRFRNLSNTLCYRQKIATPFGLLPPPAGFGDFDVIHLHEYRTIQNVLLRHYAVSRHIPYILQSHGTLTTYFQKGRLKRVFDALWGHRILMDAARVITLTTLEVEQYRSLGVGDDKIEVIPNGIDLSEFEHLPPRGEFRRKYALDDNLRLVLFLGRLNWIKGLDLLVRAFADSMKELGKAKLVIVGPDDGFLPALKRLVQELSIEKDVLFTGPLYRESRLAAYVDAAVYVLPSFYDTFPVTVLEAMACGLPVILTDRCGLADVVGSQAGLTVPYERKQLGRALVDMLEDEEMRRAFGWQGRLMVQEKFGWDRIANQLERLYRQV